MLNNPPHMLLKLLQKKAIQKIADTKATGDLIGNEIANKISKVSKSSPQNNFETVEREKEIPKERYRSLEKVQQIIDNIRLL